MSLNSTGNFEHEFNSERIYDGLDSSSLARLLIQALDNSADPMLVWDSEDRLIAVNKAMVEISDQLSFTPKAGQTLYEFYGDLFENVEGSGADKEAFIKKRIRDRNENFGQPRITETTNGLINEAIDTKLPDGSVVTVLRDITHEKALENEIAKSNQLVEALEKSSDPVLIWDKDDKLSFFNRAFAQTMTEAGIALEVGETYSNFLVNQFNSLPDQGVSQDTWVKNRETIRSENFGQPRFTETPDGRIFEVMDTRLSDGSIISVTRDVSQEKALQIEKDRSDQLLNAIEEMPGGVLIWSPEKELRLFNKFGAKIVPSEIYVGLTAQKLADDLGAVAKENRSSTEELAEILEKILFEPGEYELPAEDGTWLKITSAALNDGGWITAISDISTEKNKEKELRSSEERFVNATGFLTVYEWDGETGEFNFTQGIYSQTEGIDTRTSSKDTSREGGGNSKSYTDLVHPDDLDRYMSAFRACIKGEAKFLDIEYRRKFDEDSDYLWLRDRAAPVRDKRTGRTKKIYGTTEDVTEERKQRQRLTALSEAFKWTAYEVDLETGNFEFENYGERDQIVSDEEFEATSDAHLSRILPEDLPEYQKQMRELITGKQKSMHVFYRLDAFNDGNHRWLEDKAVAVRNTETGRTERILGFNEDVHETKSEAEAMRSSQERLLEALDVFPGGVVLRDQSGKIISANKKGRFLASGWRSGLDPNNAEELGSIEFAEQIFMDLKANVKNAHGLDRPVSELSDQEILVLADEYVNEIENIAIGATSDLEPWVERNDGTVWSGNTSKLADGSTLELRFDITELREKEKALSLARDEANKANEAKSLFLANMSHELRTPLNAVIGLASLLKDDAEEDGHTDYQEPLERIHRAGKHLLSLINDVLDVSKIEAGKVELFVEEFPASEVIDDVIFSSKELAAQNGNQLEFSSDGSVHLLKSDRTRLRQIIYNLVSNACKFTENGKITLDLKTAQTSNDRFEISVADTGIGMTEEQIKKLFSSFTQADSSTTRKYGGTGLGLSISKQLAELMGGSLIVQSSENKGSIFTLNLPVNCAVEEAPATISEPVKDKDNATDSTILVIDDDPTVHELMKEHLKKEGFKVILAESGEVGLRLAKEKKPHAITLDILMPGMDGWTVLRELKRDPDTENIPIVMASILDDKKASFALGASDFVSKPVDPADLKKALGRLFSFTANLTALVVEDDRDSRLYLKRLLQDLGCSVSEAENGKIAIEQLAKNTEFPDIIFLDLMMPEMDGFQFAEEFRKLPDSSDVPIVVVTAADLTKKDFDRITANVETIFKKAELDVAEIAAQVQKVSLSLKGD